MSNFFHNLGIGIVSTFVAFTGLFHQIPIEKDQNLQTQTVVSSISESIQTVSTSTSEKTQTTISNGIETKKSVQFLTENPVVNKPPTTEDKIDQNILINNQKEVEQNKLIVQSKVDLPTQQTSVTQKDTDKGTPYQGQDGNWYYPKAFDVNGRNLQAPVAVISGSSVSDLDLATTTDGQYFAVPIQVFKIMGKTSDSKLSKLSVHFTITGDVKIAKAYLYQGSSAPLASTVVRDDGVAIFIIPDGAVGAKFGMDIPTQFTINANLINVSTNTVDCHVLSGKMVNFKKTGVSKFTIKSIINPIDVVLHNESGDEVRVTGSTSGNTIQNKINSCGLLPTNSNSAGA